MNLYRTCVVQLVQVRQPGARPTAAGGAAPATALHGAAAAGAAPITASAVATAPATATATATATAAVRQLGVWVAPAGPHQRLGPCRLLLRVVLLRRHVMVVVLWALPRRGGGRGVPLRRLPLPLRLRRVLRLLRAARLVLVVLQARLQGALLAPLLHHERGCGHKTGAGGGGWRLVPIALHRRPAEVTRVQASPEDHRDRQPHMQECSC